MSCPVLVECPPNHYQTSDEGHSEMSTSEMDLSSSEMCSCMLENKVTQSCLSLPTTPVDKNAPDDKRKLLAVPRTTTNRKHKSVPHLTSRSSFICYCKKPLEDENVTKVLRAVESDHWVKTNPEDNKNRRTLLIHRDKAQPFGFTLQTYLLSDSELRFHRVTYVDYVELYGPSYNAGLRAGDVILSINGHKIQEYDHTELVKYIGWLQCMRLVVVFENCIQKIELWAKLIRLKRLLADKNLELRMLSMQEREITHRSRSSLEESAVPTYQTDHQRKLSAHTSAEDFKSVAGFVVPARKRSHSTPSCSTASVDCH